MTKIAKLQLLPRAVRRHMRESLETEQNTRNLINAYVNDAKCLYAKNGMGIIDFISYKFECTRNEAIATFKWATVFDEKPVNSVTEGLYTVACDKGGQFWIVRLDPTEQARGPHVTARSAWDHAAKLNAAQPNKETVQ